MSLVIPGMARPSNLHLSPEQVKSVELDADAYDWMKRLPEEVIGGERLFVVIHEDHPRPYVIMEHADDGSDMFVLRTDHLGADTLETLRRAVKIPLHQRLAEFEKAEAKAEQERQEAEHADLYERIGGPLYRDLHRYGFAHGRAESFRPMNATARRSRAAESKRRKRNALGVKGLRV